MFSEEKEKKVLYVAVQQFYKISTNYDEYISFKNKDGQLDYKLIPGYRYGFHNNCCRRW